MYVQCIVSKSQAKREIRPLKRPVNVSTSELGPLRKGPGSEEVLDTDRCFVFPRQYPVMSRNHDVFALTTKVSAFARNHQIRPGSDDTNFQVLWFIQPIHKAAFSV